MMNGLGILQRALDLISLPFTPVIELSNTYLLKTFRSPYRSDII